VFSEPQPHEAELRRGRYVDVDAAPHGGHILDARPVEQAEEVGVDIQPGVAAEGEFTSDTQIDGRIAGPFVRVAAYEARRSLFGLPSPFASGGAACRAARKSLIQLLFLR
jgi:hypothetical protein